MNEYSAFSQGIDKSVISKAQFGDRAALQLIYESFFAASFKLAYRLSASKTASEDIVHNGFIKVLSNIATFKHEGSFVGWLRQIMVNESLTYLRKHKKFTWDVELDTCDKSRDENCLSSLDVTTETFFDRSWWEACNDLFVLMKGLSASSRTVLVLHEIEGYSHREIGALLNKSESFSKQVLARTMHKLREEVSKEAKTYASNG